VTAALCTCDGETCAFSDTATSGVVMVTCLACGVAAPWDRRPLTLRLIDAPPHHPRASTLRRLVRLIALTLARVDRAGLMNPY
jgi:hypothetical protein